MTVQVDDIDIAAGGYFQRFHEIQHVDRLSADSNVDIRRRMPGIGRLQGADNMCGVDSERPP